MRTPQRKPAAQKSAEPASEGKLPGTNQHVMRLRTLAHDLGNSLEAILQAAYLLKRAKNDDDAQRWVQLIDTSSHDAARINRDMRKVLRALCQDTPPQDPDPR